MQTPYVELVRARPVRKTAKGEYAARVLQPNRSSILIHHCLCRVVIASFRGHKVEGARQVGADHRQQVAIKAGGV